MFNLILDKYYKPKVISNLLIIEVFWILSYILMTPQ
jgi:hypothetical protein